MLLKALSCLSSQATIMRLRWTQHDPSKMTRGMALSGSRRKSVAKKRTKKASFPVLSMILPGNFLCFHGSLWSWRSRIALSSRRRLQWVCLVSKKLLSVCDSVLSRSQYPPFCLSSSFRSFKVWVLSCYSFLCVITAREAVHCIFWFKRLVGNHANNNGLARVATQPHWLLTETLTIVVLLFLQQGGATMVRTSLLIFRAPTVHWP
jgi:hypothetical protein